MKQPMFKLYFNMNGWEKVNSFQYNEDLTLRFYAMDHLVQTMKMIANKYKRYYFMIIENVYDCDNVLAVTRSEEDFNEFILHYNDSKVNYEDLSCIELKRLILEKQNSIK